MIIDVHGHLGPWRFSGNDASTADDNVAFMDRHGIDVQLVSSSEAVQYDPEAGNTALAKVLETAPRLRGLLVIDPREVAVAERQIAALPPSFVGAKIHTHYARTLPGSTAMADALRLCADAGLPVLVHTWGREVVELAEAVARVEGVYAVAAHMGGPGWRLAPDAVARTDRVLLEACWSQAPRGRIRWVLDRVGADRLLFGSDATLIDPGVTLGAIRAARLDTDEERRVMHANAVALFGDRVLPR